MKQCLGFALNIPTMCSDTQPCLTLCDPMDCSLPGSSVRDYPGQEHWSGLPFPPPGYLSDPAIEPTSTRES